MATPMKRIQEVIDILKSSDVPFANTNIPVSHSRLGVVQASLALGKDYNITEVAELDGTTTYFVNEDMNTKEIYLAGLYAYRNYAFQEHHTAVNKAINFKTINFAVTGLTERSKELMRIVWWCDTEIGRALSHFDKPLGSSQEMRGE